MKDKTMPDRPLAFKPHSIFFSEELLSQDFLLLRLTQPQAMKWTIIRR
jgi:hypothetical protein